MTTYTKISELPVTTTLTDDDKFIVETLTGTKACTREALREETQITPADIGLGNVDNTSDLDKPISTATQTALNSCLQSATAATIYVTKTEATNNITSTTFTVLTTTTQTVAGAINELNGLVSGVETLLSQI